MRKKNALSKRILSLFMAVLIAFTTATNDAYAEGLTEGEAPVYEYDDLIDVNDVSGDDSALDISENEYSVDVSENGDSADVSGTEIIADVTPNEPNGAEDIETSQEGDVSDNSENRDNADVSADDVFAGETESSESSVPEWFVPGYVPNPFEKPVGEIT